MNKFSLMTSLIVLGLASLVSAQPFTSLYSFTGGADGDEPWAA